MQLTQQNMQIHKCLTRKININACNRRHGQKHFSYVDYHMPSKLHKSYRTDLVTWIQWKNLRELPSWILNKIIQTFSPISIDWLRSILILNWCFSWLMPISDRWHVIRTLPCKSHLKPVVVSNCFALHFVKLTAKCELQWSWMRVSIRPCYWEKLQTSLWFDRTVHS